MSEPKSPFILSGGEPWHKYESPSSDEEWELFARAMVFGLARLSDSDGMREFPTWLTIVEEFVHASRHERASWLLDAPYPGAKNPDDPDELTAEQLALDSDAEYLIEHLVASGRVEWVTREGRLWLRVNYLEEVLANPVWLPTYQTQDNWTERRDRLTALRTMPYRDYLQSEEWRARRTRHLEYAGSRCQLCNSDEQPLHVHHRTYERRGFERSADLVVLCAECHEAFHKTRGLR